MLHEDWCALPRHLGRADERRGPGVGLIVEAVVTSKTAVTYLSETHLPFQWDTLQNCLEHTFNFK